jgi:hypothetical protein
MDFSARHTPGVLPERSSIDAVFLLGNVSALNVAAFCEPAAAAEFLDREVAREPRALKRHVQRVLLHVHEGDAGRLQAALIDAFIALGASGRALKRRLLAYAWPLLNSTQRGLFCRALAAGLRREDWCTAVRGAMLSRCVPGCLDYVIREDTESSTLSALEQARLLLEEGDVEGARSLLESERRASPYDREVRDELRRIYVATRDLAALAELNAEECPDHERCE